jgi:DNA uptake protein ComE-like DNA-binding protein
MQSGISGARLLKGSRVVLSCSIIALLGICAAAAQLPARPVLDPAKELAAIKSASILDSNPADSQAVQQVCTACHSSSQYLGTPRSSSRWEQVFGQMAQQGAHPTDQQVDQIVNTSPAEELGPTLQIDDAAATAIIMRRVQKKFAGIADLAAIPGVDRSVLELLKDRLQF